MKSTENLLHEYFAIQHSLARLEPLLDIHTRYVRGERETWAFHLMDEVNRQTCEQMKECLLRLKRHIIESPEYIEIMTNDFRCPIITLSLSAFMELTEQFPDRMQFLPYRLKDCRRRTNSEAEEIRSPIKTTGIPTTVPDAIHFLQILLTEAMICTALT